MNHPRNDLIGIALVVLSPIGHLSGYAQTNSEMRAVSLLSRQFETVIYTRTGLLASADVLNSNEYASEHRTSEQELRFPFLELIGALTALGPNAVRDLKGGYRAVLVGARDFTSPEGLGMVTSHTCYIAVPQEGMQPNLASDFRQAQQETIDGRQIWTWSFPPF